MKKINTTNQKGCSLLAHDLSSLNVDIALITETHLRSSIPDSYINIHGYNIFRRDRNTCKCRRSECTFPHKGGGVLIFCRSSLHAECFDVADDCESLWIKLSSFDSNPDPLLVNVSYHPPNTDGTILINYLSKSISKILSSSPLSTLIIGGDFNRLSLQELETRFCLITLDSPPSRGDVCLDLFLTNKPHQVDSTCTYEPSLKSDHLALILTPINRIPPNRTKVTFTDYSFKGFQKLNESINNTDFSYLFRISDVDEAANLLDFSISEIVTNTFPRRTITMSDRDPPWITPKTKYLLHKRKKANKKNDSCTSNAISDKLLKQKLSFLKKNKVKTFWEEVDHVTSRQITNKSISASAFDGNQLNIDLANRSAQTNHHETPTPLPIFHTLNVTKSPPQLNLLEVATAMHRCKRTSPGPINIPFFIFRIFWDILAPLYLYVWNLSLDSSKFPSCYKQANLTPIPKKSNATNSNDIRGISVTPISARLFEKLVHTKWILPNIVRLGDPLQFAYRPKISTSDCLITLQHYVMSALDEPNVDGVHIITIDFSKAFDRLNQTIASRKFPNFVDEYLSKWLYDFSTNRSQRLSWHGKLFPFLNIDLGCSQGTVGGPNIFSIFTDDCRAKHKSNKMIKYSDDSTLLVPCYLDPNNKQVTFLNEEFENVSSWSEANRLTINTSKSHHMRFSLNHHPCCSCNPTALDTKNQINILGITFQSNCRFSYHVKRLINLLRRSLYVIRDLRLNSFPQDSIDQVFDALIVSRVRYGISIYGSDIHALNKIDNFLESCHRHGHTSIRHSAHDILHCEDNRITLNILHNPSHPLHSVLTQNQKQRTTRHNLSYIKPRTNTIAFSKAFCNRVLPL